MKRVLREVVLGAVGVATAVGAATMLDAPVAHAQAAPQPGAPPAAAPGAAAPAPAPVPNIRRITVEGNQRIESSTVLNYLVVRAGEPFNSERIDLSLKALFQTGLFEDVQMQQRGPDLVVLVKENPIVNQVLFEGVNALKEEDLEKEIQAKPRSVFTPGRAQSDVQRIMELYRRNGRFGASITPTIRKLEQNRVDVIFEIDEGPVTGVRAVNITGNEVFSDRDLRDAIITQRSVWWKFFSKRDSYDPDQLEFDRERLRQYYTNRGYADFRVVSAVAELTPDQKDFLINFTVEEGEKYDFGKINVDTKLDEGKKALLMAQLPIREGDLFNAELIEKSLERLSFAAGTFGFANAEIRQRVTRNRDTRTIDIDFEVNEGPRVFVERIDIVGNNRTVDPVIRRELRVVEGDTFNKVLLDRSQARVRALGYFKKVEVEEKRGSADDRKVVEVKIEEDNTGELAFAAGFSSQDSFLFDVSVTERNLRGRGQFLRLRASTSSRSQQLELRFTEPRFMGRNLAAGFELFSLRTDFLDEASFENQSTGLGLRSSFPVTDTTNLGLTYTLRQDSTTVDPLQCIGPNPALICAQAGDFLTSVAGYTFNWDRRNDPIRPTGGFQMSLQQDFAGLGGEVKYLRSEFDGAVYRGLFPEVVASLALSGGYVLGWGDDTVRINDRFFKGGSSFRGFDVAGLGPRQIITVTDPATGNVDTFNQDSLGGKAYAIATAQLEFPFWGVPKDFGISGALFAEVGSLGLLDSRDKARTSFTDPTTGVVTDLFAEDDFSLRGAAGVSVFWDSPFGPVQFDFSYPFAKESYDRTETFRFTQRTRF